MTVARPELHDEDHYAEIDRPTKGRAVLRRHFRSGIKVLSVQDLERLTEAAVSHPRWSATGRPEWLRRNRDEIVYVSMILYGQDGTDALRCLVMVEIKDKTKGKFTLDVSPHDYKGLPDMSAADLAYRYLATFPSIPLDPTQQAAWDRLEGRDSWAAGP